MPKGSTSIPRASVAETLRRRQHAQVLARPFPLRRLMAPLAARAFLPAPAPGREHLAFASPLQPFESVRLVVLYRTLDAGASGGGGSGGEVAHLRVFAPVFDPVTAVTRWDASALTSAHDLNRPFDRGAGAVRTSNRPLARVALALDRAAEAAARRPFLVPGPPVMPRVLLALPAGTEPRPQPTPWVLAHARRRSVPWGVAWDELYEAWSPGSHGVRGDPGVPGVPGAGALWGVELLDVRLAPAMARWSVGEWLDLSDVTDHATHGGRLPRPQAWRPASIDAQGLRFGDEGHHCDWWGTEPAVAHQSVSARTRRGHAA